MTLPGNAGEQAARDILRGPEAEQTNTKVFIDASAPLHFTQYAAPALRDMPPDYAADVYAAARNLNITRIPKPGRTARNANVWHPTRQPPLRAHHNTTETTG